MGGGLLIAGHGRSGGALPKQPVPPAIVYRRVIRILCDEQIYNFLDLRLADLLLCKELRDLGRSCGIDGW